MAWTEGELTEYLSGLPDGHEISLTELRARSEWSVKDLQSFIAAYEVRDIKTVRHEAAFTLDDAIYMPRRKRIPILRVGGKKEERREIEEIPREAVKPGEGPLPRVEAPAMIEVSATTVTVQVDQRFIEGDLVRRLVRAGIPRHEAEETVTWWRRLGHLEEVPTPPGFPTYYPPTLLRTVPTAKAEEKEIKTETHRLPKTRWDPLEFYEYLQSTFGWSRVDAMAYFRELQDQALIERVRFRDYRIPREIEISVTAMVEEKPLPEMWQAILRWKAYSGKSTRKVKNYDQDHEFDSYLRLPKGMDLNTVRQAMADMMQLILDSKSYPDISLILSDWNPRDIDWMFTAAVTQVWKPDGRWEKRYQGNEIDSGSLFEEDLDKIYRQYGVLVI